MNDYLEHYNHNHDALGRFARSIGSASSAVGSKLASKKKEKSNVTRKYESTQRLAKKKTKASEAVVKNRQKGSKSNNTKLSDSERRRLVEHGSAKEITKHKDKLSNRELEVAITRLQKEQSTRSDLEKKLSDLNDPTSAKNVKSFVDKLSDAGTTLNKVTNAVDSGVKAYNMAAKIHNASSPDKWAVVGENNAKNDILKMQKVVMTGSMADVWKNREKMTPDQYKNAINRFKNDDELQRMMKDSSKPSKSSSNTPKSESKDKTPTHQSFFQEPQTTTKPESWSEVREKDIPKIKETIQTRSENRANDILSKYQDYPTGTSQKNTSEVKERVAETKNTSVEELKKKKQGYGKYLRED